MSSKNHTPIDHIIAARKKVPQSSQSRPVESEPFSSSKKEVIVHEVVEHEVKDPQIKKHVEVRKDIPQIPQDLKKLGITTPATTSFSTYQSLKLPLEEEKLPKALNAPLTDSFRWLGELTKYLIEQSQNGVKTAHQSIIQNFFRMIGRDFGK